MPNDMLRDDTGAYYYKGQAYLVARDAAKLLEYSDIGSVARLANKSRVEHIPNPHNRRQRLYNREQLIRAYNERSEKSIPQAQLPYIPARYNKFWRLRGDKIVIADCHCPLVDFKFFEDSVLRVRDTWKIGELILAGDTLDCAAFSRFYDLVPIPWQDEKEVGRRFLKRCAEEFDKVWVLTANHEMRYFKKLWLTHDQRILLRASVMDLWQLVTAEIEKETKKRLNFSIYPYCVINEKPGPGWRILHPNTARKIPLSFAREMAAVHSQNIVVTHAHMSAWSYAPNTAYQLIDCGVFADPQYFSYKQLRVTAHFKWSQTFCIIKDNKGFICRKDDKTPVVF